MSQQKFISMFDEFTFSKQHKGKMLTDVIAEDKGFVRWVYEKDIIEIDEKIEKQFNKEMGYE